MAFACLLETLFLCNSSIQEPRLKFSLDGLKFLLAYYDGFLKRWLYNFRIQLGIADIIFPDLK